MALAKHTVEWQCSTSCVHSPMALWQFDLKTGVQSFIHCHLCIGDDWLLSIAVHPLVLCMYVYTSVEERRIEGKHGL